MRNEDVCVVGLGAMGSAALYHLARQGAAPVGIDQYRTGHAFGSSHGHSRAFRTFYHDPIYVELAEASLPLWQELETLSGEQLLTLSGFLDFARKGNAAFEAKVHVMQGLDTPYEVLTPEEVGARFPALRLPADTVAFYTPRAGFLDANRCVQAHLSQAVRFGATIHEEVRVHHIDLDKDQPEIETSAGRYRCSRLIVTPGPWASDILQALSLPLHVTRQQKFYFRPRDTAAYQPDRLPVYSDNETQYYGFPNHGPGIKVADDTHGSVTSPEAVDRTLDLQKRDDLKQWLEKIMPGSDVSFVEGATCMYTLTPDHDFLIGPHPKNPNLLVGAGFSGHGFKFSTLVGKILAELATDGRTPYPIERFRLSRFG
ncbi:MAG: N-methyl-L-tryptophan oxidase [Candidatus Poribacteria bacterium]|nr:N-methyl-L-tryptophan oxidase [Candidatus Poribacteria bacterium]